MPVTAQGRDKATASQVALRLWRDGPRVDESPRRVQRHKRTDDRGVCSPRVHREDAAATVRGVRRDQDQSYPSDSALGPSRGSDSLWVADEVHVRSEIDITKHDTARRRILYMPTSLDLPLH
jgi:hypothetical protein